MKLVWHIIAKDLRQDKWPLGFWLMLFVAHQALGSAFLNTDGTDLDWIDQLRLCNLLLTVFEFAIGYLLALRWVQWDALSGTRMFWVTRPISGGRLLAAKATGLLLVFGLLPLLIWLPWWLGCGLGAHEIGWLAAEMAGGQLLLIASALLIGSLTDDFGRAIMWSLLLVAALVAWSILGQASSSGNSRQAARAFAGLWFSRLWVVSVVLVIGFFAIAAAQFVTRNSLRSMVRIAVLGVVVGLVGRFWPLDISEKMAGWGQPPSPELAPLAGENIRFSPTKVRLSGYAYRKLGAAGPEDVHSLIVSIEVEGLPGDLALENGHNFQALLWNDQPAVRTDGRHGSGIFRMETFFRENLSLPAVARDPETIRWGREKLKTLNAARAAKGLAPHEDNWDRPPDETVVLRTYLSIPKSALPRLKAGAPTYVTRIEASLVRPEIRQQLSLKPGERGSGASPSLRVVSVGVDDHVVRFVATTPAFLRDGLFRVRTVQAIPRDRPRTELWAVSHTTGDIHEVHNRSLVPVAINVGGVAIAWSEAVMHPARWTRNGQSVIKDPEWRKNTSLVVTAYPVVGRFTRAIRGDNLAVQFPPEAPAPGNPPESAGAN